MAKSVEVVLSIIMPVTHKQRIRDGNILVEVAPNVKIDACRANVLEIGKVIMIKLRSHTI